MLANKSGGTYKKPNLFVKENGKYNYVDAYIKDEEEYVRVNDPGISIFSDNKPGLHLNIDDAIKANEDALGSELFGGPTGFTTSTRVAVTDMGGGRIRFTTTAVGNANVFQIGASHIGFFSSKLTLVSNPSNISIEIYARNQAFKPSGTALGGRIASGVATDSAEIFSLFFVSTEVGQFFEIEGISVKEIDLSKCQAFQDPAGTLPVVAMEQPLGLLLDSSLGLTYGPNLAVGNTATFDSGTGLWSGQLGATISAVSGEMVITQNETNGRAFIELSCTAGVWVEITANIRSINGVGVAMGIARYFNGAGAAFGQSVTSSTTTPVRIVGKAHPDNPSLLRLSIGANGGGTGVFAADNISVRELPGNHAYNQSSSTNRPTVSRRVNLSPQGVTGGSAGIIGSGGVLPSGVAINNSAGLTTEVLATDLSPALGGGCRIRISGTAANASLYRLKLNEAVTSVFGGTILVLKQALTIRSGQFPAGSSPLVYFVNVGVTAAIGASVGGVLGDTVYSTIPYASASSGVYSELRFAMIAGQSVDVTIEFAATDIRLASDAIATIPAYQRVTSASDYDEKGFPAYLRRQTDDWSKAHINPNGATKVFVLTAIQKMSDAVAGVNFESSANYTVNNGTLVLFGPSSGGSKNYAVAARGTAAEYMARTIAAPERTVLSIGVDLTANTIQLIPNGAAFPPEYKTLGGGVFTEQDFYFGSRAGTSFFVNDREYSPPLIAFLPSSNPGFDSITIKRLTDLFNRSIKAF